ncbi:MAG TPA: Gfo/Idh/MocA family oxidoreductase [Polyangia bacterium]
MAERVRVAVVGAGYWGINHVRAFSRAPSAELVAVCDPDPAALARAAPLAPKAALQPSFEALLTDETIEAVVLATPAARHADQARAALASGKHVFVEKPLALSAPDAESVVAAASSAKKTLMVGHLMLYHPGYEKLRALTLGGELGEVYYLYALRVNLGRLRKDENALWSFAPHDLSMILDLVGALPSSVAARGESYLQPGIEDVVFLNLAFPDRKMAQVQLSWLDPRKERRLTVVGSKKMVELDDVHPTEKLRIYDKGYDRPPAFTQYGEYLTVRHGDIHIPKLDLAEPLALEVRHFLDCARTGAPPRSGGASGLAVVQVLAAAQRSLESGGAPITLG